MGVMAFSISLRVICLAGRGGEGVAGGEREGREKRRRGRGVRGIKWENRRLGARRELCGGMGGRGAHAAPSPACGTEQPKPSRLHRTSSPGPAQHRGDGSSSAWVWQSSAPSVDRSIGDKGAAIDREMALQRPGNGNVCLETATRNGRAPALPRGHKGGESHSRAQTAPKSSSAPS